MSPLAALLLVVASSFAWSGLDLLRKILVERISPLAMLFYLTAGMSPLYAVWVAVDGSFHLPREYWLPAAASVALNVVANLAFFESVRRSPLSLTIPLLSFTPVFATLLAVALVGERPTAWQVAGSLLVVVGALLLHLRGSQGGLRGLVRAFLSEPGAPLMLLTALLWSATISLDKLAMEAAGAPQHALVLTLALGSIALALLAVKGRLGDLRAASHRPGVLAAALVVGAAALGLQLVALQAVAVGLLETLKRGLGNALAVLWGRLFFGEAVTPGKLAGVALMALGVALVILL